MRSLPAPVIRSRHPPDQEYSLADEISPQARAMLTVLAAPHVLTEAVLEVVEADANKVMAPSLRPKRISELEREATELAYQEEVLVVQPVERRSDARPEAILQVRIVVAKAQPAPVEKKIRAVA